MRTMFVRAARVTAGLLAGLAVTAFLAHVTLFGLGYRSVAVYSGSMVPTLAVGSVAYEKPVDARTVRVGQIVTFQDPYEPKRLVTHRVIRVLHDDRGLAYRTKGDANPARDPWTIRLPGRVGRVSFSVPYVGYALVYARTREVRGLLILLACSGLLVTALRRIWRSDADKAATPA